MKKNYRENVHYIENRTVNLPKQNGGQNKITVMLTEEAFEIFKNSFNMRNRYIVDVSKEVTSDSLQMHTAMS